MPALPAHIVSINLCADQYLLALADRGQIAGVTRYALDPGMSAAAAAARTVPTTRATAEELLVLAPDLILAAPYQVAAKAAWLPATRIVAVPDATDVPAIEANIRTVATAVGHPERAAPLIASLRAQLAAVVPGGGGVVAAHYQRGGYLTGTATLIDDLIHRAGMTNLAARLDRPPLSRLSLEEIIAARPDVLLSETRKHAADRGAAMLDHPALARAFPPATRRTIDAAWTVCGGPAYPRAVRALTARVTP